MNKDIKQYIKWSKLDSGFKYINNIKLQEILYLFSWYVFYIYFENIKNTYLSEELKEIQSHTIFIYLGSIIEAIIYYFVQTKLTDEKSKRKYLEVKQFRKLQKIKETQDLYICKLETKEITLNDSINFHALINWLKDKKLIPKNIIKKIDYFRKMINLVHINALISYNEIELITEIEKAFIDKKEIFDYIETNIWNEK